MPDSIFDVAIVGAGPAGTTAGYLLALGGLRVALLDKFKFPRDKTCGDGLTPRAVRVLDTLGILPEIEREAYRVSAMTVRVSEDVSYRMELTPPGRPVNYILVLPRLKLDEILLNHAVAAGAQFIPNSKVLDLVQETNEVVSLKLEGRGTIQSRLAIVATGANSRLLRTAGLLRRAPPSNLAARTYFENVDGLDDTIMLFFDGVEKPGYGWVFPVAPRVANIGCGVFFDSSTPQPSHLAHLVREHPFLQRILKNARQVGPIKGYPLRTDFSPSLSGQGRVMVTGESIGLVNPITGEGIDYALESAQLAATTILSHWQAGSSPVAIQKEYRQLLGSKFRIPFALGHLVQKLYFRDGLIDRILGRVQHRAYLHRVVVEACFGLVKPFDLFTPRTLWELLKPAMVASATERRFGGET